MESYNAHILVSALVALLISSLVFRPCLYFAKKYNIVDKPDKRKLQDHPIPVFGGITVVLGMLIPILFATYYCHATQLWYAIGAILILWFIGVLDDIHGLSASLRFILELGIIWILLWQPSMETNGWMINNLGGLWDRFNISLYTAIPLTLLAGVGIINSINLIDGVDGYSSGYGIISNIIFAHFFFNVNDYPMVIFSLATAAALIPFYLHNIFGNTSKMFIGDGGSLVIGFVMAYNVFAVLDLSSPCNILPTQGISIVALTLAILCIPVFDTVRVMLARLFRGVSPFMPDKTHFHHLFIDMGFSHAATSTTIILLQLIFILIWYVCYRLGMSINGQCYIVIILGLSTWLFYYIMRHQQKKNTNLWHKCCALGKRTHLESQGIWLHIQNILDKI